MGKGIDKICPECGRSFLAENNRFKYCSDGCRRSAALEKVKKCQKEKNKSGIISKKCCICGKEFVDATINHCKNTCSPECRRAKQQENYQKWKAENPDSYKESQKRSIDRKKKTGYWRKYRIKKALLAKKRQ